MVLLLVPTDLFHSINHFPLPCGTFSFFFLAEKELFLAENLFMYAGVHMLHYDAMRKKICKKQKGDAKIPRSVRFITS